MSATKTLAQFISEVSYEDFSSEVVTAAKIAIADGVANMLAGSTQELATTIGRYVETMGGAALSTVVGWGFKTNPPFAAFANGVFGHCLDFEIQGFPPTHGTSSCLPAAFALAEDRGASGKTIIEAYTLGWEVQGRLRAASSRATNPAYHPPGLVGPLGGAAASAKVLGLSPGQTEMALGIAASRTGGLTANTGTMVKSTHPGNAARMGAESALLAEAGFTSSEDIFERANGYAEALFQGQMDWDVITADLGESFRLVDPGYDIKRFPAQIHMQNPIESVLNLGIVPGFYPTICSGPQTPGTICHHFTQRRRTGYLPDTNSTKTLNRIQDRPRFTSGRRLIRQHRARGNSLQPSLATDARREPASAQGCQPERNSRRTQGPPPCSSGQREQLRLKGHGPIEINDGS